MALHEVVANAVALKAEAVKVETEAEEVAALELTTSMWVEEVMVIEDEVGVMGFMEAMLDLAEVSEEVPVEDVEALHRCTR